MREIPRPIIRRHGLARALAETPDGAEVVVAETDAWLEVEGNVYFPPEALGYRGSDDESKEEEDSEEEDSEDEDEDSDDEDDNEGDEEEEEEEEEEEPRARPRAPTVEFTSPRSGLRTYCTWKGGAEWHDIVIDGGQ